MPRSKEKRSSRSGPASGNLLSCADARAQAHRLPSDVSDVGRRCVQRLGQRQRDQQRRGNRRGQLDGGGLYRRIVLQRRHERRAFDLERRQEPLRKHFGRQLRCVRVIRPVELVGCGQQQRRWPALPPTPAPPQLWYWHQSYLSTGNSDEPAAARRSSIRRSTRATPASPSGTRPATTSTSPASTLDAADRHAVRHRPRASGAADHRALRLLERACCTRTGTSPRGGRGRDPVHCAAGAVATCCRRSTRCRPCERRLRERHRRAGSASATRASPRYQRQRLLRRQRLRRDRRQRHRHRQRALHAGAHPHARGASTTSSSGCGPSDLPARQPGTSRCSTTPTPTAVTSAGSAVDAASATTGLDRVRPGVQQPRPAPRSRSTSACGAATRATLWIDDILAEETSLVNVLRRGGTPVSVYERQHDLHRGHRLRDQSSTPPERRRRATTTTGTPRPTVTVPAGSRLQVGQTVSANYYTVDPARGRAGRRRA